MSDLIGQTLLSQYRVDAFVAAGGMGAVYRVWDLKRNVPLAMKVLHSELADDPSMFKRFQREGRALQKLAHPNIVPFYGLYQTMDFAFMLERFVDGPSLKDVLKRSKGKPIPMEDVLVYLKTLCAALGYAHANGVVHCDVKPGNVMIDTGGNIYLTDFGIARHAESATTTFAAAGTAAYMPPEQILGEPVTPATDVYALGVILYEMITGKRPFRGGEMGTSQSESGATLNIRIRQEQLHVPAQDPRELVPTIPEELAKAILAALSKKPSDRFAGAPQFFGAVCKAVGISPDSVKERVVLSEFSENRDYATGKEVVKGTTPKDRPPFRSPMLIGGIVVAGVLGCVVLAVAGALMLSGGNKPAEPVSGPGNPSSSSQEISQPSPTSIPANTLPPSTSTPDFAVRTAEALLTQAAALPKSTNTPAGPNCPGLEIEKVGKTGGQFLEICAEGKEYEIGPLADGVYAIGPNQKFFVYVTYYGLVYAARVGDTTPTYIGEVKRLTIIRVDDNPKFEIQFNGNHPYTVTIRELWESQDMTLPIPRYITTPN